MIDESTGEADEMRTMLAGEEGGVMVMIAIFLPVLVLLVSFVIDIGNWFVHKRHLQTQADAAALAGAAEFSPCFVDPDTGNAAIESMARLYSGDEAGAHNEQLGGTSDEEVHFVLNSANYYENSGPVDETVVEAPPCEAGMVDVKMTETDLPLFLQVVDGLLSVDYINTHARVEIFERSFFTGGLPFGVQDPNPEVGRVIFVDESTNPATVLGSRDLTRSGTTDGLAMWDNEAEPFPLEVNSNKIGVRVAFGGATSTQCGDPLVECYDLEDPNLGLLHVRGYSNAGSGAQPNPPLARSVYLYAGSCADPYFVDTDVACTVGVGAEVDFGPCDSLSTVGAKLTANLAGSNQGHSLELLSCPSGTSTSTWETTEPLTIDPEAGPVEFELKWEETAGRIGANTCEARGNNACKGSFGVVQRTYGAAEERSGPIRFAQLWEGGSAWANSLEACSSVQTNCTYDVVARVGMDLNLSENADSVDDDLVTLRFGQGNQNQTLDCDPSVPNLEQEIARGCDRKYARNQGSTCPDQPNDLWAMAEPWQCVAVQTGLEVGNLRKGMNQRVHFDQNPTSCVSPNNWSDFPNFAAGDPRIVPLFLTPFGVFSGTGNTTVPVTGFATFYVTGWDNSDQTCPGDSTYDGDDVAPSKAMVGHFIKYTQSLNDGSGGEEQCDFNELGSCVAVMTE